jgi:TonB-linked SusC/RagA family outer membrane protein
MKNIKKLSVMTNLKNRESKAFKKAILMLCFTLMTVGSAFAQKITVKGVVEDDAGRLISNAIVKIGNSVDSTDYFGKFKIEAKSGDVLLISKVGYKARKVKASSALTVVLSTNGDNKTVDLLYQNVKARDVSSSVSTIDNKSLNNNSVLAFSNALYGKLAGLNLRQADGEPGDDYASMLIRGRHSFTGTSSPLVLVDGFEREFNTLGVDEVESVSVLKDAASTALYGMDGANGVILVTTKRGLVGKTSVGLKVEHGYATPTRLPEFYGSYDYARFYNQAQTNDGKTPSQLLYSDAQLKGYSLDQDPRKYPNVNWFDQTIRDYSPTTKYLVDFRGGNKVAKYYVNVGLENSEGLFKNTDHITLDESGNSYSTNRNMNRINFRSNVDINVTNRFSVQIDLSGRLEDINSPTNSTASIFNNLYTFHPNVSQVYVSPNVYGGTNSYKNNPVAYLNEMGFKKTHRRYFQSNIVGKYDLSDYVKGLSVGVRATFDNAYTVTDGMSKTYAVVDTASNIYGTNSSLTSTGIGSSEYEISSNNLELFTDYNRTFGKHKIGAMAMYHQDEYVTSTDFPDRRITFSGKFSYIYDKKYIVDVAAQYGGNEHFMAGKRFGLFPAISGAWVLSEEDFLKNNTTISFLKLRASTGLVGNQNIGGTRFGYRTLYNTNGSEMPLGNPLLTWEKSYKTDFGIDATICKDIDINVTYFNEFRDDILNSGAYITPAYLGNTFGYTNYGQIKSNGLEVSILAEHKYLNWGYHVGANATFVTNKITRMNELVRQWDYLYQQGNPIGQRYGFVAEGLFQSQAEIDAAPVQTFGKVIPGSIRYKDLNNDGVINSDDYTAIGKDATVPTLDLGFNLGFNVKGFYVDANFQAAVGREVNLRSDSEGAMYAVTPLYGDKNVSTFVKNPWTIDNAAYADFPSLSIENAANNFQTSTYWLRNGDFLRLRSLEVGFNLPKSFIKNIGISSANIYVRGMNLFTLDHLKYFDPEVMEGYPVMKSYNVGVNFKF